MTIMEQRERNFKLSKVIIDHFGQTFFRGKKVLDLGSGNGEFANIFAKLGCDVTCVDIRESNLDIIRKKFPHIKTLSLNLEEDLPFEEFSFDLILSIDLLCHLKNYSKHIESILSISENIVLETEIADSSDPNHFIPIFESRDMDNMAFSGQGSIVSDKNIQNKIASLNAKYKRIDETKLNDHNNRYDWSINNIGRKIGNRRFWIIRRDKLLIKKLRAVQDIKNINLQYSDLFLNSTNKQKQVVIPPAPSLPQNEPIYPVYTANIIKKKKFVVIIPSYNNAKWCEKNILSALSQDYSNFRVIFTDDRSSDNTFDLVSKLVANHKNKDKCVLIKNSIRKGAMENLYDMVYSCDDDEIILTLDGDDWLFDNKVISKVNEYYTDNNIWMTYGQYKNSNDNSIGISGPYSNSIINNNSFRKSSWRASHLRTFYTWLFKKVRKSDFLYEGKFLSMSWDLAMMLGMLEMSGDRSKFISDILYVYNTDNPINDNKVNGALQRKLDLYLRTIPKYQKLPNAPELKNKELSILTFRELGRYGRLGNQCFQVAVLLSLAYKNNCIINSNWYCHYTNKDMLKYFKNKMMSLSDIKTKIEFDYKEPHFHYNEIPFHKNMNMHGYFQTEKYFEDCKDIIRYYFEPADEVINKIKLKYDKYLNTNTCSIHIRRGDFVGNNTHSVCDLDFYKRAINKINSTEKIDNFLVFSDDIAWCKKNLPNNYIFIEGNLDIEDLFLQSLCNHNIISNSSFSWWGAWLNKNKDKIIISPSKWFNNKSNNEDKDIFTKEMIKI